MGAWGEDVEGKGGRSMRCAHMRSRSNPNKSCFEAAQKMNCSVAEPRKAVLNSRAPWDPLLCRSNAQQMLSSESKGQAHSKGKASHTNTKQSTCEGSKYNTNRDFQLTWQEKSGNADGASRAPQKPRPAYNFQASLSRTAVAYLPRARQGSGENGGGSKNAKLPATSSS